MAPASRRRGGRAGRGVGAGRLSPHWGPLRGGETRAAGERAPWVSPSSPLTLRLPQSRGWCSCRGPGLAPFQTPAYSAVPMVVPPPTWFARQLLTLQMFPEDPARRKREQPLLLLLLRVPRPRSPQVSSAAAGAVRARTPRSRSWREPVWELPAAVGVAPSALGVPVRQGSPVGGSPLCLESPWGLVAKMAWMTPKLSAVTGKLWMSHSPPRKPKQRSV